MTVNEPEKPPFQWWPPSPELIQLLGVWIRNVVLMAGGLYGIYFETTVSQSSDQNLLILFALMIGFPLIRWGDR